METSLSSDIVSQIEEPHLLSERNDFLLDWKLEILASQPQSFLEYGHLHPLA